MAVQLGDKEDTMIELRSPSPEFLEVAKSWHDDENLNHYTGFGRGEASKKLAKAALDKILKNDPKESNLFFQAVWLANDPIGYVVFSDIDRQNRNADLHVTLSPENHGKGLGPEVLKSSVNLGFSQGLYRITFKPFVSNKRAIKAAFKAGFKLEAKTKFSVWTVDGPQDQAQMRVVKPEWKNS